MSVYEFFKAYPEMYAVVGGVLCVAAAWIGSGIFVRIHDRWFAKQYKAMTGRDLSA